MSEYYDNSGVECISYHANVGSVAKLIMILKGRQNFNMPLRNLRRGGKIKDVEL
jgi:hypothetical protein